jgi:hypothetical protein
VRRGGRPGGLGDGAARRRDRPRRRRAHIEGDRPDDPREARTLTYHVTHTTEAGERVAGGEVAAAPDWADFADWAALLPPDFYPELCHLGAGGWCAPAPALDDLEAELAAALRHERPGAGVAAVGERLLAAVRRRPGGAAALRVSGGRGGA